MNDKLNTAIEAYAQARDAYFDLTATETLETRKNVYDCAAHQVAFLMWLDMPRESLPSSHPDFLRLLESIEQHPEPSIIEPDAAHWNAIGRHPSELEKEELPAYLTDQTVFEDMMHQEFWWHNNEMVRVRCVQNDPACPNPGWPIPCPKCNFCFQNPDEDTMEPEPGESQDVDSSDWTTAATEEDIQSWASDSRDLEDFFDEDDDWDDSDWYDDHGDDWSYYGSDDDYEEVDDGSNHASRDPLSGKCYCPYCNSECAPDVCNVCHSELTPPAIDTQMRTDLPDEPPF